MRCFWAIAVALVCAAPSQTATASAPQPETEQPQTNPKDRTNGNESPDLPDTNTGDGFRVDSGGGSIGVEISTGGSGAGSGARTGGAVSFTGTGTGSVSPGPVCTHRAALYGDYPTVVPPGNPVTIDLAAQLFSDVGPNPRLGWIRTCAGTDDFYWTVLIDPVDLIPDALARARSLLPVPQPNINPAADAGGIVNLGMWLAIDDPGSTTARATLANAWAEVTAQITSITVDFGNGDTVTCDGVGTPILDTAWDSLDQGPCGYTYRESSPDDSPYDMTVTATHRVNWTTSDGRAGTLSPIDRRVTIAYDVDEVQTVGTRG